MTSLDEVVQFINNLGFDKTQLENTLNMGEIKEIPRFLSPNEQIDFIRMVSFSGNGNPLAMSLLVITNHRFFILDKKMFGTNIYDFFYNKIVNIEVNQSVGMLTISFTLQNNETQSISIKNDAWGEKIYNLIRANI